MNSDPASLDKMMPACPHTFLIFLPCSRGVACERCVKVWERSTKRRNERRFMEATDEKLCGKCYWEKGDLGCSCDQKSWKEANPDGGHEFD